MTYIKLLGKKMDTSQLEYTAEDLISSYLQKNNILVAKPKFDVLGTDLLAFTEMKDGIKFCRIQSKGRSLTQSKKSNITISRDYVSGGFVVFLYLDFGGSDQELYVFFQTDIERWSVNPKEEYQLSLSASNAKKKLELYRFDAGKTNLIKTIIQNAEVSGEFSRLIYGRVNTTELEDVFSIKSTVGPVDTDA